MSKTRYFLTGLLLVLLAAPAAYPESEPRKRDYAGFTLWLDCDVHHGAVAFYYEAGPRRARARVKNKAFKFDRKLSPSCQPQSWRSYRTTTVNPADGTWDRGLLVPPRHLDGKAATATNAYLLTNTLPQSSVFNGPEGAWHRTEIMTDCYRERTRLKIWGGVIWGRNKDNDYFTLTHGIETPDYWWKLIYREDTRRYVAWIFPNSRSAQAAHIDRFTVSFEDLQSRVDFVPPTALVALAKNAAGFSLTSWPVAQAEDGLSCEE